MSYILILAKGDVTTCLEPRNTLSDDIANKPADVCSPSPVQNFVYSFDSECDGPEIRMYEGSGDNPGKSLLGRRIACANACKNKNKPLNSVSWTNFELRGFIVTETGGNLGRCYCETYPSSTCKRQAPNDYNRYDFGG